MALRETEERYIDHIYENDARFIQTYIHSYIHTNYNKTKKSIYLYIQTYLHSYLHTEICQ
jgi:hypothetical protein